MAVSRLCSCCTSRSLHPQHNTTGSNTAKHPSKSAAPTHLAAAASSRRLPQLNRGRKPSSSPGRTWAPGHQRARVHLSSAVALVVRNYKDDSQGRSSARTAARPGSSGAVPRAFASHAPFLRGARRKGSAAARPEPWGAVPRAFASHAPFLRASRRKGPCGRWSQQHRRHAKAGNALRTGHRKRRRRRSVAHEQTRQALHPVHHRPLLVGAPCLFSIQQYASRRLFRLVPEGILPWARVTVSAYCRAADTDPGEQHHFVLRIRVLVGLGDAFSKVHGLPDKTILGLPGPEAPS
mmetsp:Transcript_81118/g.216694  ORF Transcript_81118/g.216694 Transcript_81118/m.216694 type:complete len:293 (-) Transcript_81118:376-1254(-)